MPLETSKYQPQAASALRLIEKKGSEIRLTRKFVTKSGEKAVQPLLVPVIYAAIVFPRTQTDTLQRWDEALTGENRALIAVKRVLEGFKGQKTGFSFSSGAGVMFSDGRLAEASKNEDMPYVFPGDRFDFGGRSVGVLHVGEINPDGEYPIMFDCLTT